MTIKLLAKPVVRNKFWIVEKDGQKIATIQRIPDGLVYVQDNVREKFPSVKKLENKYNILFDKIRKEHEQRTVATLPEEFDIDGYPTTHKPCNILYDVKKKIHIYTKNNKSKSYFCAGYYLIQFANGWMKSYCPKLITITRYPYQGPFKSKLEMQERLRISNGE